MQETVRCLKDLIRKVEELPKGHEDMTGLFVVYPEDVIRTIEVMIEDINFKSNQSNNELGYKGLS